MALWQGDETRALALSRQALDIAVAAKTREVEVWAWLRLGAAELALGRRTAARDAYARAHARAMDIHHPLQHDASAGLARVALAECHAAGVVAAMAVLQPLLERVGAAARSTAPTPLA